MESPLHFFETSSPGVGNTITYWVNNLGQTPERGERSISLIPLYLPKPINLRRLSLITRATPASGAVPVVSAALYKVSSRSLNKRATLDTSVVASGTPALTGLLEMTLLLDLGKNTMQSGSDGEVMHFTAESEFPLLPEMFPFVGLTATPFVNTQFYSPHSILIQPNCGYVATELGPGFVVGPPDQAYGWPRRVEIDRQTRVLTPPYLCLRSSIGVRLYGDPQDG